MRRYAVGMALVLVVLVTASAWLGTTVSREHSLAESRRLSQAIADALVAPLITDELSDPRSEDAELLDRLMRSRIEDGSMVRVKIWRPDGTIVWSDQEELIGRRFEIEPQDRELFGTHDATAELSSLDKPENARERAAGELIEVYAGTIGADGSPILFEAYLPANEILEQSKTLVTALLAMSVGVLVLFAAAAVPLGLSLARRVERSQQQRARMIRHGLLASDLERRRIAADLHDSVIPDLAGVVYLLPVVKDRVANGDEAESYLDRIRDIVARNVAALRSALVIVHPPDLERAGLGVVLGDLAAEAEPHGLVAEVEVREGFSAPLLAEQLICRVVREGLRNVTRHARASRAEVRVWEADGMVHVEVTDNGVGPRLGPDGTVVIPAGHLGLTLLADTVRDLGGCLELSEGDEAGARLSVRFPQDVDAP